MANRKVSKRPKAKAILRLPDLEQSKNAVLHSLAAASSQESYGHAIDEFITWYCSEPRLAFNRTVVLRYRFFLEQKNLAPSTINVRLAAVRRLAYEASDTGLLSPELAAGIRRVKGAKRLGVRIGNWLTVDQSRTLLGKPPSDNLRGKRDRAILALLIGCGLRRAELVGLGTEDFQVREEHWVIANLVGKGGHIRTIPVPDWVKAGIDAWVASSGITAGILLRSINKAGRVWGCGFSPKVIWGVVKEKAKILRRMTFVGLVPVFVIRQAVSWSKSSSYWDTFPCKQPSDISDADSGSTTRSMIGLGSNRIGRDLRKFHITGRLLRNDSL